MRFPTYAAAAIVSLLFSLLVPITHLTEAVAATRSDFDPGNIISDQVFFDSGTMTVSQVQQFLDLKGANCEKGQENCLKDYKAPTIKMAAEQGLCNGYQADSSQSAAEIIVGVANSCGINPRVLIVLLEKEQSLVTRTHPTTRSYQVATGFGCPDTAECNTQYYGLFNQLYRAARQFQRYAVEAHRYSYKAGQTNTIRWHPNAACGTSQVYISNQATAGLYNYTPYRPNSAALNNLYGTGDSCSAYGNRNFWRIFTDWFGSTQTSSSLLRASGSTATYLVSDNHKYLIPNNHTLAALSPLGEVGVVSAQYLSRLTTGPDVVRSLYAADGTIYFFDAGIILPFSSCTQLEDYGMSCSSLVAVSDAIISAFHRGPALTNLYRTTSGGTYWVEAGKKHEVIDEPSRRAAGLPSAGVTLLETGLRHLPYGEPIVRDQVVLTTSDGKTGGVVVDNTYVPFTAPLLQTPGLAELPRFVVNVKSLQALSSAATAGLLISDSKRTYLLTTRGKVRVRDPQATGAGATVPDDLVALLPAAGTTPTQVLVKGAASSTVYLVRHGELRAVASWSDLTRIAGTSRPRIYTVSDTSALPQGPTQVAPGTLIVSRASSQVYMVDGLDERIPVSSFAVADQIGATRLVWFSSANLRGYDASAEAVTTKLQCGSKTYLGLAGHLYLVNSGMSRVYDLDVTEADPATCAALPKETRKLNRFLRTPDGTIYYVEDGAVRKIRSYSKYVQLGGRANNTISVTRATISLFDAGRPL